MKVLVTGASGFIGTNICLALKASGANVVAVDNHSRPGSMRNVPLLTSAGIMINVSDYRDVIHLVHDVDFVIHLAAQVAVTDSLVGPLTDFETNTVGTVDLLEEIRMSAKHPPILYMSTNKVYGDLHPELYSKQADRWVPYDLKLLRAGFDESTQLNFRSPYGCSKGAADQYVLDYAYSYGLPTTVFRASCIYGEHQHGTVDQGWAMHLILSALAGEPITIWGDGGQVRDMLYVGDLVRAILLVMEDPALHAGQAYNMGGGPANSVSLNEFLKLLSGYIALPEIRYVSQPRVGDQKWYVTNHGKFTEATGWQPEVQFEDGFYRSLQWAKERA